MAGPVLLVVLLATPALGTSGTSIRAWSAPFHGHFSETARSVTGRCAGAANDTAKSAPAFNATTGAVTFYSQSNVTGATCAGLPTEAKVLTTFTFRTFNFSVPAGAHSIAITWTVRWFAQLTVTGGATNRSFPASASYWLGGNGATLCDMSSGGTCQRFPNSTARGSGGGWLEHAETSGSNVSVFRTATVTFYLNTSFAAHAQYRISTSMYAETSAQARRPGHSARAFLLLLPILGCSARLVGISIS
ncbi:MAG TPA: hypothetical protein VGV89_10795 [Thermoplasmata archaeon]|nr:hypothetical protein [Thermoplasmata archaeon]